MSWDSSAMVASGCASEALIAVPLVYLDWRRKRRMSGDSFPMVASRCAFKASRAAPLVLLDWRGKRRRSWDSFFTVASCCSSDIPIAVPLVCLTRAKGEDLILRIISDLQAFKAQLPCTHVGLVSDVATAGVAGCP